MTVTWRKWRDLNPRTLAGRSLSSGAGARSVGFTPVLTCENSNASNSGSGPERTRTETTTETTPRERPSPHPTHCTSRTSTRRWSSRIRWYTTSPRPPKVSTRSARSGFSRR